jgi:hypothetical protein
MYLCSCAPQHEADREVVSRLPIPSTVAVTWAGGSTNFGVISTEAQTKKRVMHRDGTML